MKSIGETHLENIDSFTLEDLSSAIQKIGPIGASMSIGLNIKEQHYNLRIPMALNESFLKECKLEKKKTTDSIEVFLSHKDGFTLPIFFEDKAGKIIDFSSPKKIIQNKESSQKIPEELKKEIKKSKIMEWFKGKYGLDEEDPRKIKMPQTFFSYRNAEGAGDFVLSTQVNMINEISHPGNDQGLKKLSKTFIQEGLVKDGSNKSLNVTSNLYVMNKEGELFTTPNSGNTGAKHHSYIIKSEEGYGKAVACGGHVDIENGKITRIDNGSGHYRPNTDQLILAVQHLHKLGVLSHDIKITDNSKGEAKDLDLKEILKIEPKKILEKYQTLEYYDKKPYVQKKNSGMGFNK